jgi:Protein of unknown function (DUF4058)
MVSEVGMETIYIRINQYRGINAHLHSLFQASSGWRGFHGNQITHIAAALQDILIPLGYIAQTEEGLQVRRLDEGTTTRIADVAIIDTNPAGRFPIPVPVASRTNEAQLPLREYMAIGIYRLQDNQTDLGPMVAWLELLSPSNKPGSSDFSSYVHKRRELLRQGVIFIELDYLHASPTTLESLRSYQPRHKGGQRMPGAHPYYILVIDPRPSWEDGEGRWVGFDVDDPIPEMRLPLAGADHITFNFNAAYQRSFTDMFYGRRVNYAALPVAFDLYSPDDQARILSRMVAVLQAAVRGDNLEQPPQPVECLPLAEAQRQFDALRG